MVRRRERWAEGMGCEVVGRLHEEIAKTSGMKETKVFYEECW